MLATARAQVCVPLGHSSLYLFIVLILHVCNLLFYYTDISLRCLQISANVKKISCVGGGESGRNTSHADIHIQRSLCAQIQVTAPRASRVVELLPIFLVWKVLENSQNVLKVLVLQIAVIAVAFSFVSYYYYY